MTRIEAAREFVLAYLADHPCTDCAETDPVVLEFDHVVAKRDLVSSLVAHGAPLARIEEELARCEVVCVNCHRRRTAHRRRLSNSAPPSTLRPLRVRNLAFLRTRLEQTGCCECDERDPVVLDFDHIGTKTMKVSELAHRECALARLEAEIELCEIRCANCHRRRTAAVAGWYRHRAA